jgi:Ni/Fe-hydrogenase 1 B-type cytochrome subunit
MRSEPFFEKEPLSFNEAHSAGIRIWHWTFFIVITGSLLTVLLASTTFRTRNTTAMVQHQLQEKSVSVTTDQARAVAHEFNDKIWDLHRIFGYVLSTLVLIRILLEIVQPGEEKLGRKIRRAVGFQPATREENKDRRHYLGVKLGYLVFYSLILLMALTGLGLAFEDVPVLKTFHQPIKSMHAFLQYLIYGYILVHLGGVFVADLRRHKGLVSGMIHGQKRV